MHFLHYQCLHDSLYLPCIFLFREEPLTETAGELFLEEHVDLDGFRDGGTVRLEEPLRSLLLMAGFNEFTSVDEDRV